MALIVCSAPASIDKVAETPTVRVLGRSRQLASTVTFVDLPT